MLSRFAITIKKKTPPFLFTYIPIRKLETFQIFVYSMHIRFFFSTLDFFPDLSNCFTLRHDHFTNNVIPENRLPSRYRISLIFESNLTKVSTQIISANEQKKKTFKSHVWSFIAAKFNVIFYAHSTLFTPDVDSYRKIISFRERKKKKPSNLALLRCRRHLHSI